MTRILHAQKASSEYRRCHTKGKVDRGEERAVVVPEGELEPGGLVGVLEILTGLETVKPIRGAGLWLSDGKTDSNVCRPV